MVKAGQYPGPQKRGGRKLDEITVVIANQRVSPVRVLKTGLGRLITGRTQRKLGLGGSPGQCMAQRLTSVHRFPACSSGKLWKHSQPRSEEHTSASELGI